MRSRAKKLAKILSLEAAEERRHGIATGKSQRQLEEQMAKLGELNAYRHNYAALSKSMANINSAHWKDYQSFLQRLDQAVQSQQQVVTDSEQNLEAHRRRWLAKRQRLDSLQRVLERYQSEEHQYLERQQQRAQDDMPRPDSPYEEPDDR